MLGLLISRVDGALLLIALASGYLVISTARKEGGAFKTLGYIIGASILLISSLLILVKLLYSSILCVNVGKEMPRHHLMFREQPPAQHPAAPAIPQK